MLAAAALAFVACSKEAEINQPKEEVTHVATISLGKADVSTKTEVIEGETSASYKWLDKDAQYLHVYENGTEGTITNFSLNADKTIATLTVSFTGTPEAPYSYTAKYANTLSGSKNPLILNEQNPGTSSFDPAADVLVSKATDDVTNLEERATEFTFTMGRVVTVNKMTLTGLEAGEVISSVEFTLDKHMAGYVSYSAENNSYSYSNGGTKLTLKYTATNGVVPANGQFPVYFVSAPVDAAGIVSVVVTTDKNVYTKSSSLNPNPFDGKTITFSIGTMKRFTMAMSGYGEEISGGVEYTLVESADNLYSGAQYIIAAADVDRAIQSYVSGNNHKAVTIEKNTTNKTVTIDNTIDAEVFIINSVTGGYTIQNAENGKYLNSDSSNNRLTESTTSEVFSISISNGVASIVSATNTDRGYMYYNGTSGSNGNLFNCYADKSKDTSGNYHLLALYIDLTTCVELEEAGLAYSVESPIEIVWDNKDSFVKPTLTNPHSLTITYTSSNPDVASVDENTGDITFVGNGTTTITASSAKTEAYKAGSAYYQITVTGAPAEKGSKDNPYTPSEARAAAIALEGNASVNDVYVKGIVSEVTTAYSSSFKNVTFNLSDDGLTTSGQFVAYREKSGYSSTVAAGDAVIVKGKIVLYNSETPEFQADNAIQTLLAKPVISGTENFTGSTSVTISAANGATIYYTTDGTDPDTNSSVYNAALTISATTTVKAIASKDGLVTGITSAAFNKVQAYAVTFGTPSNGTITVKHGETTLASGDEIAAGETITITTTPSSGYVLSTLVYNDGSDHDIKSAKSFTMPASAVSITATFEESHGGTYSMTPNGTTTGSTAASYITTLTEFTHDGVSWKMNQWNPSSLQIKTNQSSAASEFRFYNTSAFSGRIKKVVITFSALTVSDASKLMFLGGTSEVTATTGGTAGTWDATAKTLTWTPSASENFTYFAFYQNGKAASGTNNLAASDAIVVEYE